MIQFDEHLFQMGWFNQHLVLVFTRKWGFSMAILVYQRVARSAGLDQTAEGITPNGGIFSEFSPTSHATIQYNSGLGTNYGKLPR